MAIGELDGRELVKDSFAVAVAVVCDVVTIAVVGTTDDIGLVVAVVIEWNVAGDEDDNAAGEETEEDGGDVVLPLVNEALGAALKVLVLYVLLDSLGLILPLPLSLGW